MGKEKEESYTEKSSEDR